MEEIKNTIVDESTEKVVEETTKNEEKVAEKVESKSKNTKKKSTTKTKECPVLAYNKCMQYMIISFDGCGIRIDGVTENPGDCVTVSYFGENGTPDFKLKVEK